MKRSLSCLFRSCLLVFRDVNVLVKEINSQASSLARTIIFSKTHLSESNGPKRIGGVSPYPVRLEGLPAAAGRGCDGDGRGGGAEGELGGGGGCVGIGGGLCWRRRRRGRVKGKEESVQVGAARWILKMGIISIWLCTDC